MSVRDELLQRMLNIICDVDRMGAPWSAAVNEIISLIESKLPMVEEECKKCLGKVFTQSIKCECKGYGKTTRRMTLDEVFEYFNRQPPLDFLEYKFVSGHKRLVAKKKS